MGSANAHYDGIKAFSETDQTSPGWHPRGTDHLGEARHACSFRGFGRWRVAGPNPANLLPGAARPS